MNNESVFSAATTNRSTLTLVPQYQSIGAGPRSNTGAEYFNGRIHEVVIYGRDMIGRNASYGLYTNSIVQAWKNLPFNA